jgi:hypothetical protein
MLFLSTVLTPQECQINQAKATCFDEEIEFGCGKQKARS